MLEQPASPATSKACLHITVLTAMGRAAIGSVCVRGPQASEVVRSYFSPRQNGGNHDGGALSSRRIYYGTWSGSPLQTGEGVVVARLDDQTIEIHCHGGNQAVAAIVRDLESAGGVLREAAAIFHESPVVRAAHHALAAAATERTAMVLLDQFQGALTNELHSIRTTLQIDPHAAAAKLQKLMESWSFGCHLHQPWQVVFAGPPNVGKSSLVNAIMGYQRSIVMDEPGTTRDVLTARTAIDGWPVELADTAGLRNTHSPLEAAGIAKTEGQLHSADCIVLVLDATQIDQHQLDEFKSCYPRAIVVHNKTDLVDHWQAADKSIGTSAKRGTGLDELLRAVANHLVPQPPAAGAPVLFTKNQYDVVRQSTDELNQDRPKTLLICWRS